MKSAPILKAMGKIDAHTYPKNQNDDLISPLSGHK